MLMQNGADANYIWKDGRTPYTYAVWKGNLYHDIIRHRIFSIIFIFMIIVILGDEEIVKILAKNPNVIQ